MNPNQGQQQRINEDPRNKSNTKNNANISTTQAGAAATNNNNDNNNAAIVTRQQRKVQKRSSLDNVEPTANVVIRGVMEKLQMVNHGRIITPLAPPASNPDSPNNNNNNPARMHASINNNNQNNNNNNNQNSNVNVFNVVHQSLLHQHQLQQQQLALGLNIHNSSIPNAVQQAHNQNLAAFTPLNKIGTPKNAGATTSNASVPSPASPPTTQQQKKRYIADTSSATNDEKNISGDDTNMESNRDGAGGVNDFNLASSRASSFSAASSSSGAEGSEAGRRKSMKSIFDGQLRAGHNQGCYVPIVLLGKGSYGQAYLVVYKPSEQELALQQEYNLQMQMAEQQKVTPPQQQQSQQQKPQASNTNLNNNINGTSPAAGAPGNSVKGDQQQQQQQRQSQLQQTGNDNTNKNTSGLGGPNLLMGPVSPQYHKTRPKNNNNNNNQIDDAASFKKDGGAASGNFSPLNFGQQSQQNDNNSSHNNTNVSQSNNNNNNTGKGVGAVAGVVNTKDGNNSSSEKNVVAEATAGIIPAQGHTTMENGIVSFTSRPSGGPAGNAGISTLACTKPTVTFGNTEYQREYIFVCKVEKDYEYDDAEKKKKAEEEKRKKKLEKRRLRMTEELQQEQQRSQQQQQRGGGGGGTDADNNENKKTTPAVSSKKRDDRKLGDSSTSDDLDLDDNGSLFGGSRRGGRRSNMSDNDNDERSARSNSSVGSSRVADDAGRQRARRMRNEAAVLANLAHPCIVGFVDSFARGGNSYLVLEYVDGGDLNKEIARRRASRAGYMTRDSILFIWAQVVLAVEYMHRHNILHRDIKAANVLLSRKWIIRLSDLGTAEQFDADTRRGVSNVPMGSPMMMAPELFMGDAATGVRKVYDEKCDIWSLGVLLWELTFFTYPFDGRDIRELAQHIVHDEPRPVARERTPRELAFLISWIMKKDPTQRPTAKQILSLDFMQKPILSVIERYQQAADSKNATPLDRMWVNVLKEHHQAILSDSNASQVNRASQARERSLRARARSTSRTGRSNNNVGGGGDDDNNKTENNNNQNNNFGHESTNPEAVSVNLNTFVQQKQQQQPQSPPNLQKLASCSPLPSSSSPQQPLQKEKSNANNNNVTVDRTSIATNLTKMTTPGHLQPENNNNNALQSGKN